MIHSLGGSNYIINETVKNIYISIAFLPKVSWFDLQ